MTFTGYQKLVLYAKTLKIFSFKMYAITSAQTHNIYNIYNIEKHNSLVQHWPTKLINGNLSRSDRIVIYINLKDSMFHSSHVSCLGVLFKWIPSDHTPSMQSNSHFVANFQHQLFKSMEEIYFESNFLNCVKNASINCSIKICLTVFSSTNLWMTKMSSV